MFIDKKSAKYFFEEKLKTVSILVIGDIILDKYYIAEVNRISQEAPVPIARVLRKNSTLGGAANVCNNLARLGCKAILCGLTGEDENRSELLKLLKKINVDTEGVFIDKRITTAKIRITSLQQQMLRLDFEDITPLKTDLMDNIKKYLLSLLPTTKGVIVSDYGKGVCTAQICSFVINEAKKKDIPVVVDPKGNNWYKYSQCYCITPNIKELAEAMRKVIKNNDKEIIRRGIEALKKYKIKNLLVTRSDKGMTLFLASNQKTIPTRAQEVFDVSGAGDTVIAVFTAAIGAGLNSIDAAELANFAAGIVVGKIGTYAVSNTELKNIIFKFLKEGQ